MLKTMMIRGLALTALVHGVAPVWGEDKPAIVAPAVPSAAATSPNPPYPERNDPFKMPSDKAALATRREAVAANLDLKLKGFVKVGQLKAVLQVSGEVVMLGAGERRGEIQVLEIAPPNLTLQRGRHRWTETMVEAHQSALPASR